MIKQDSDNALKGAMELLILCEIRKNIENNHLTSLIGWYMKDRCLHIVTEYMSNGTLQTYLRKMDPNDYPHDVFRRIIGQIAGGMRALESRGIEHRELSTRNIYFDSKMNIHVSMKYILLNKHK